MFLRCLFDSLAPEKYNKMEVMDIIVYGQHWFSGSGSKPLAVPLLTYCHAFLRIPSHLMLGIWMPLAFLHSLVDSSQPCISPLSFMVMLCFCIKSGMCNSLMFPIFMYL